MIDIHQNMPISLILTPFDYFQIRPSFAVTPNLILEPCHMLGLCQFIFGKISSLKFFTVTVTINRYEDTKIQRYKDTTYLGGIAVPMSPF